MDRKLLKIAKRIYAEDDADIQKEFDQIKDLTRNLNKKFTSAAAKQEDADNESYIKIHQLLENLEKFVENAKSLKQFKNYNNFQRSLHDFLKKSVDDSYGELLYHSNDAHGMIGNIDSGIGRLYNYCNMQKIKIVKN